MDDIEQKQIRAEKVMDLSASNPTLQAAARDLMEVYLQAAQAYPDSTNSPLFLYKAAKLKAYPFKKYDETISMLNELRQDYPEHPVAERALFLIGYTYSEQLADHDQAREVYQEFLDTYPQSELSASVRFELNNMGKPVSELDFLKNGDKP